jgi:hypothetical protein
MRRAAVLASLVPFAFLAPGSGAAAGTDSDPPECRLQELAPERVSYPAGVPDYGARVSADGRYEFYTRDGKTHVVDLENPKTEVVIPGEVDPVPAPPSGGDHKSQYLAVSSGGNLEFYRTQDVVGAMASDKSTDLTSKLKASDEKSGAGADSPSIGLLSSGSAKPVYRVLTAGLSFDDYDTKSKPWKSIRHHDPVCGESGRYRLPTLSKDGKEIAAYDTVDGTTQILAVKDDGTCKLELNLGFGTGRVDFSYDGKSIAFHLDTYSDEDGGKRFKTVSAGAVKNVYVLQLNRQGGAVKPGELRRITDNAHPGEGSFNPTFSRDGKVTYTHLERDAAGFSRASFRTVNPKLSAPSDFLVMPQSNCRARMAARFALGSMWNSVCSDLIARLGPTEGALWTLSLDPKACAELVKKYWPSYASKAAADETLLRPGQFTKEDLAGLTETAVLAACPQASSVQPRPPARVLEAIPASRKTAAQVFDQHCSDCHEDKDRDLALSSTPKSEKERQAALDQVNNMLIAISSGAMPKDTELPNRQVVLQPLVDALRARQAALEELAP